MGEKHRLFVELDQSHFSRQLATAHSRAAWEGEVFQRHWASLAGFFGQFLGG